MSEIVEAVTSDQFEQVRTLFRDYRSELPLQLCFGKFEEELANLPFHYGPPGGKLLLALVVGQPVGCVGLRPFPLDSVCEMKRLYVRPAFRNGKIGHVLVNRVMSEALGLGYTRLRLDTHPPSMAAAVRLYRKLGFLEVPAIPLEPVPWLLYMEIALSPADAIR